MTGPIEYTSLITCIATRVGALERNSIPFIEGDRAYIDEAYLIERHKLKKDPNDSLIFFYLCFTNEISLPNVEFHLYNCHSLTIPFVRREGGRRHGTSGLPVRMTWSRTRREPETTSPPQHTQTSYHHEASGSSWHNASAEEWARQAPRRRSTSSSSSGPPISAGRSASSRGFATLTWQMGELNMCTNNIEESLGQHIESTQNWQRHTCERIHKMEQQQQ